MTRIWLGVFSATVLMLVVLRFRDDPATAAKVFGGAILFVAVVYAAIFVAKSKR